MRTVALAWPEEKRLPDVSFTVHAELASEPNRFELIRPGLTKRQARVLAGKKPENYMAGSTVNSVITVSTCPAIAVPCGFDQYGRPVGLQLVGRPRGEAALLQAASLYENLVGLHKLLPIDPKPGTVPPSVP